MSDARPFGLLVLAGAGVVLLAVLSNRLSARARVPTAALFLAAAALAAAIDPDLHALPHRTVERIVTVALVVILFDGGHSLDRPTRPRRHAPAAEHDGREARVRKTS